MHYRQKKLPSAIHGQRKDCMDFNGLFVSYTSSFCFWWLAKVLSWCNLNKNRLSVLKEKPNWAGGQARSGRKIVEVRTQKSPLCEWWMARLDNLFFYHVSMVFFFSCNNNSALNLDLIGLAHKNIKNFTENDKYFFIEYFELWRS